MVLSYSILQGNEDLTLFCCGDSRQHKKLDKFLKERAKKHQNECIGTTYLVWNKTIKNRQLVGYMTLLADGIVVEEKNKLNFLNEVFVKHKYDSYPALKIGRLAVHKNYNHNSKNAGLNVGTYLFKLAMGITKKLNDVVGARFIVVDSKDMSLNWYLQKLKFKILDEEKEKNFLYYDIFGWKK
jgi:hypothetical protein